MAGMEATAPPARPRAFAPGTALSQAQLSTASTKLRSLEEAKSERDAELRARALDSWIPDVRRLLSCSAVLMVLDVVVAGVFSSPLHVFRGHHKQ